MSQLKFKLTLAAKKSAYPMGYRDKTLLVGSCFSENIGAKLSSHLFQIVENPHGILFNPMSVTNSLIDCIQNKTYIVTDLFPLNKVWNSWNHHSRFSGLTPNEALLKINSSIHQGHTFLKTANHLIITLGSAWGYQLNNESPFPLGQVVANNHKAPSAWFDKRLMKPNELIELLINLVNKLLAFNPHLHIVFTVSPVRHLREGLVENNRSKAVLIHAVHEVVTAFENLDYFPSYEYVMDDLRDYRFYSEDMVHPNYAASNYVWEKLVESYMNEETQSIMKQIAELQLAMQHKPFFAGSTQHQEFLQNCIKKTENLLNFYPYLALDDQLQFFKHQIGK